MKRTLVIALIALLPALLPAPLLPQAAAADEDPDGEARRRFRRGTKLFDEGKFREAAHEFELGYAVLPKTGFLLNIAHSYRRSGDLKKAKRYYEMFLQQETDSPRQRGEVTEYIKLVDEQLAEQARDDLGDDKQVIKDRLAARPSGQPAPALVDARVDATADCKEPPNSLTRALPWVLAGAAGALAFGLGVALIVTNR